MNILRGIVYNDISDIESRLFKTGYTDEVADKLIQWGLMIDDGVPRKIERTDHLNFFLGNYLIVSIAPDDFNAYAEHRDCFLAYERPELFTFKPFEADSGMKAAMKVFDETREKIAAQAFFPFLIIIFEIDPDTKAIKRLQSVHLGDPSSFKDLLTDERVYILDDGSSCIYENGWPDDDETEIFWYTNNGIVWYTRNHLNAHHLGDDTLLTG